MPLVDGIEARAKSGSPIQPPHSSSPPIPTATNCTRPPVLAGATGYTLEDNLPDLIHQLEHAHGRGACGININQM